MGGDPREHLGGHLGPRAHSGSGRRHRHRDPPGLLIAKGLLRLNLSAFFRWSGAFLIIIAAGVLAYGFHDLQEAGVIPGLNSLAFDVSETIPPTSWYGVLLKGIFNFSPATTWSSSPCGGSTSSSSAPSSSAACAPRRNRHRRRLPAESPRPEIPCTTADCADHITTHTPPPRTPAETTPKDGNESTQPRHRVVIALGASIVLSGCEPNDQSNGAIAVTSTDDKCDVAATEAPAGTLKFDVTNEGSKVTEFYLLGEDGLRIIGEVENIAPGLERSLTVTAPEGKYFTACKPGMVGEGLRGDFTVTKGKGGEQVSAEDSQLAEQATTQYAAYVKDQTEQLLTGTEEFAKAYKDGDDDKARELYPKTRTNWERIEPVAESFGDLDPKLDLREADLEEGQEWTGWHRIEKDLWPPKDGYTAMSQADRVKYADLLVADTKVLYDRTRSMTFTPDQLSNGAKELLDEVATGKVTGEEETWSHTDLWTSRPTSTAHGSPMRTSSRSWPPGTRTSMRRSRPGSPTCRRCSTRIARATGSSSTPS